MNLVSIVPGFEGPCRATWINKNQICQRLDGGTSGFFKLIWVIKIGFLKFGIKTGKSFHGIIKNASWIVETTEREE